MTRIRNHSATVHVVPLVIRGNHDVDVADFETLEAIEA